MNIYMGSCNGYRGYVNLFNQEIQTAGSLGSVPKLSQKDYEFCKLIHCHLNEFAVL